MEFDQVTTIATSTYQIGDMYCIGLSKTSIYIIVWNVIIFVLLISGLIIDCAVKHKCCFKIKG